MIYYYYYYHNIIYWVLYHTREIERENNNYKQHSNVPRTLLLLYSLSRDVVNTHEKMFSSLSLSLERNKLISKKYLVLVSRTPNNEVSHSFNVRLRQSHDYCASKVKIDFFPWFFVISCFFFFSDIIALFSVYCKHFFYLLVTQYVEPTINNQTNIAIETTRNRVHQSNINPPKIPIQSSNSF